MPCYTRVTSEVTFGPKTDLALLTGALTKLGLTVTGNGTTRLSFIGTVNNEGIVGDFHAATGEMTATGDTQLDMNLFKRAYSAEVIRHSAQRFGWAVQQKSDTQYTVQRRI